MRLTGKVAVITGAGRGIGAALAEGFAGEGAAVVVNYSRPAQAADEVVARIQAEGGRAVAIRGDVGVLDDHAALLDAARSHFGALHILVNNAAIDHRVPILEATPDQWDAVQSVDLRGPFFLGRYVELFEKEGDYYARFHEDVRQPDWFPVNPGW